MANTRLFVGNIPYTTTEADLRELFARHGEVASVRIITDFDSGRSRGYAFVEMATPEDAERAVQRLHSQSLSGRTIVVNEARPRAAPNASGRAQGSGNPHLTKAKI